MAIGTNDRPKVHLNIGTLGHVDHGKTTLAAALTKVLAGAGLAQFTAYEQIDKAPEVRSGGIAMHAAQVTFESPSRSYRLVDCPGHADYVKQIVMGAAAMDGAILVVSAADGVMPQTREHIQLVRRVGVPHLIVFINKADMVGSSELLALVEREVVAVLTEAGFEGNECPLIKGSALQALRCGCGRRECPKCCPMLDLLDACDAIPQPDRPVDLPFLMAIEEACTSGATSTATGVIERGAARVEDAVEVPSQGAPARATIKSIVVFGKSCLEAGASDRVTLTLEVENAAAVARGGVVAQPGTTTCHKRFEAEACALAKEEGGRQSAFFKGYRPLFAIRTALISGVVVGVSTDQEMVMPGDNAAVEIDLDNAVALEKGLRFAILEGERTVGAGTVTRIVE